MKIVVPQFVLDVLRPRACELLDACDLVVIDDEGVVHDSQGVVLDTQGVVLDTQGRVDEQLAGTEIVMLPWSLPNATVRTLLSPASLRWVHTVTAGVDHVVSALPPDREVQITNAAGVFDVPIAETVLAYILFFAKRLRELEVQQQERIWHLMRLQEVAGLTVGILGMGGIGTEVARRCKAFDMRVLGMRRHPERGEVFVDEMVGPDQLARILKASDFVVIALPATPATWGLLGRSELSLMRSDAVVINVARGAILDQDALVDALSEGRIGGAALDVFVEEPLPAGSPLWDLPNVLITPHNSWSTPHFKTREADLFLANLERYTEGVPLINVVDPARGY